MKRLIAILPVAACLGLTLSPIVADAYKYNKAGKKIPLHNRVDWNWERKMPYGNTNRLRYGVTRVTGPTHPVKEGNTALRFEARPGDCGWADPGGSCSKAGDGSVQTNAAVDHFPWNSIDRENTTRWYSQDFYLPPGAKYQPQNELFLNEWHHAGCDASIETHYGYSKSKKSYELIFLNHGRAPWTDCCNVDQDKGYKKRVTVPTGEWINVRQQILWSRKSNGLFRVWVNGKRVVNLKGPTLLSKKSCGGVYLMTGIIGHLSTKDKQVVVYQDNLRIGRTEAEMRTSYHPFWQDSGCRNKTLINSCRAVKYTGSDNDPWPGYVGKNKNKGPVITRPKGGESWKKGKRYLVRWVKGDAGSYVKLELYRNAKRYRTITKKTRNDGAFKWKIPASVLTGDKYQVRVTSTSSKKRYYLSDGFFSIK